MRTYILLIVATIIMIGCKPTQQTTKKELERLQGIVDAAALNIERCDADVRKKCLGIVKSEKYNKEATSLLENKELVKKCFKERMEKCRDEEFVVSQMPKSENVFPFHSFQYIRSNVVNSVTWKYPWGECMFSGLHEDPFIEQDKIYCTSTKEHITYIRELSTLAFFPYPHYTYPTRNCMAMGDKELALAVCKLVTQDKSPKVQKIPNNSENAFVYTYQKE